MTQPRQLDKRSPRELRFEQSCERSDGLGPPLFGAVRWEGAAPIPDAGGSDFSDVEGSPHAAAIRSVAEAGIATGYPDGTFRPTEPVSPGQMASFLARALDLHAQQPAPFTDTDGNSHDDAIAAVAEAGIATGYPDGTFRPTEPVSPGQMASFLARALDLG